MKSKNSKADKFEQVAAVTLKLLDKNGLNSLKLSQISKLTKISRAWMYKYIGKDKEAVVEFALQYLGKTFSELDIPSDTSSVSAWIASQVQGQRNGFEKSVRLPWVVTLYYQNRSAPNIIGKHIELLEFYYVNQLAKEIRHLFKLSEEQAQLAAELHMSFKMAMNHYWVTSKDRSDEKKEKIMKIILKRLNVVFSKI